MDQILLWLIVIAGILLAGEIILPFVFHFLGKQFNRRFLEHNSLQTQIDRLLQVEMEKPFVNLETFRKDWPTLEKNSVEGLQYDVYCCMVFNLLERLYLYCGGQTDFQDTPNLFCLAKVLERMREFLYIDELILDHERWWWFNDGQNQKGYCKGLNWIITIVIAGSVKENENETKTNSESK